MKLKQILNDSRAGMKHEQGISNQCDTSCMHYLFTAIVAGVIADTEKQSCMVYFFIHPPLACMHCVLIQK